MRSKYSPVITQNLGGAPQQDFEYEKKLQEYKEAKDHIVSLKKVIDNFPKKLEGYKQVLETIGATSEFIFQKNNKDCYQFMHNISSAHKALSEKLNLLFTQFTQIKNNSNIWVKELNSVTNKCNIREECKKKYDHYEKKLYELNEDRRQELKKKNKVGESDHERFIRNIGKFQKSGKELIFASNSAFKSIEQFMNNRYDRVIMTMVSLVEAERNFYNEANHILNFFSNIRNNAFNLKKSYISLNTNYDASLYLRGRTIINMSVEEIFSPNYQIAPLPNQAYQGQQNNYNANNNNNTHEIINPFSADSNTQENNNMNMKGNNYGYNNNYNNYNKSGFQNKSTRETFAMSNPYNSQANNNNNYGRTNTYNNNNNMNNPYMAKDEYDPFGSNSNRYNPYNSNNPWGNNNNMNNNKNDPWGNNNSNNNKNDPWGNNNNINNNINKKNSNNNNSNNKNNNNNNKNNNQGPMDNIDNNNNNNNNKNNNEDDDDDFNF